MPDEPRAAAEDPAHASPWAVTYARGAKPLLEPPPPGMVRIHLLTDPWSVWCWGFEPVRRALALRYPSIEFQALVGGMFPRLPKPEEVGFDVARFFATVQRTTGMPVSPDAALRDRPDSTYPACQFVHAARLLAPEKEARFLRALREAAYLDGRNISRPEVAAEVAGKVGIAPAEFQEALASGEPEREFAERITTLQAMNLHAYPTLLVAWADRTARVEGFQSLPAVLGIAQFVSGRLHAEREPPDLLAAVPPGERVATREVAEALGLSFEAAYDGLREAERAGTLARQRLASGDAWKLR